jgi:DNA gyrase/topoisomerase IV subunit B
MYLSDCVSKIASEAELFILNPGPMYEAAKVGRDRLTQAILPINERIDSGGEWIDMAQNDQCQSLIACLGVGIQFTPEPDPSLFNLQNLRYEKLIVVTDQTKEGMHIRNEVLRYLNTYSRPILHAGFVYVPEIDLEPGFTQEDFETHILNPETRRLKVASLENV